MRSKFFLGVDNRLPSFYIASNAWRVTLSDIESMIVASGLASLCCGCCCCGSCCCEFPARPEESLIIISIESSCFDIVGSRMHTARYMSCCRFSIYCEIRRRFPDVETFVQRDWRNLRYRYVVNKSACSEAEFSSGVFGSDCCEFKFTNHCFVHIVMFPIT